MAPAPVLILNSKPTNPRTFTNAAGAGLYGDKNRGFDKWDSGPRPGTTMGRPGGDSSGSTVGSGAKKGTTSLGQLDGAAPAGGCAIGVSVAAARSTAIPPKSPREGGKIAKSPRSLAGKKKKAGNKLLVVSPRQP